MSVRTDKFCDDLKVRLNAIETSVQRAKENVTSAPARLEQSVRAKLADAKTRVETRNARLKNDAVQVKAKLKAEITEAKGKIQNWKANHEADKLARYADDAAQYAADALVDVSYDLDVAEVAVLEALEARAAAEDAIASLPA